jgi:hypothetical protein
MLPPLEMTGEWGVLSFRNTMFTLEALSFDACPLGEGGQPKGRGWIRLEEAESAKEMEKLKYSIFPNTRKISSLLEAAAILGCSVMGHSSSARNDRGGMGKYTEKTFSVK